jgi:hypothetical protein
MQLDTSPYQSPVTVERRRVLVGFGLLLKSTGVVVGQPYLWWLLRGYESLG